MTCDRVAQFLIERERVPDAVLEAQVLKHLSGCNDCRALAQSFADLTRENNLDEGAKARIVAELRKSFHPVSPLPPVRVLMLETIAVFVVLPVAALAVLRSYGGAAASVIQIGSHTTCYRRRRSNP